MPPPTGSRPGWTSGCTAVTDRAAYIDRYIGKYGSRTLDSLKAKPYYSAPANYGSAGTSRWDRDGREIFTGLTLPEMETILKERGHAL